MSGSHSKTQAIPLLLRTVVCFLGFMTLFYFYYSRDVEDYTFIENASLFSRNFNDCNGEYSPINTVISFLSQVRNDTTDIIVIFNSTIIL